MSDRKRKKRYFQAGTKKPKTQYNRPPLCSGMKGFLVTTNDKPFQTIKEAYTILQEFYDKSKPDETDKIKGENENSDDEDISKSIQKEKEKLKTDRDFSEAETGAKNVMFVYTKLADVTPSEIVHRIFTDTQKAGSQTSRFIQKLYPVDVTCRAYRDDLKKAAGPLLTTHFKDTGSSYEIVFRARIHNKVEMSRRDVLEIIPELVKEVSPMSRVNLNEPDKTIIVEVIKNVCCLSVVTDFKNFRKLNLHELCKPATETNTNEGTETQSKDDEETGKNDSATTENRNNGELSTEKIPDNSETGKADDATPSGEIPDSSIKKSQDAVENDKNSEES